MGNFAENLNLGKRVLPPPADFANSKRHQRLGEILMFLPALYRKSTIKTNLSCMKRAHHSNRRAYAAQTGLR